MYVIHYFSETGYVDSGLYHHHYFDDVAIAEKFAKDTMKRDCRIEKANIVDCDTLEIVKEL